MNRDFYKVMKRIREELKTGYTRKRVRIFFYSINSIFTIPFFHTLYNALSCKEDRGSEKINIYIYVCCCVYQDVENDKKEIEKNASWLFLSSLSLSKYLVHSILMEERVQSRKPDVVTLASSTRFSSLSLSLFPPSFHPFLVSILQARFFFNARKERERERKS